MSETQELKVKFGDLVENGWAAKDNPQRLGFFVGRFTRTGRLNAGPCIELTDGKGSFWTVGAHDESKLRVIYTRSAREAELEAALDEAERALDALVATVRGECPSLLNEDSGGNASLSEQVDAALSRIKSVKGGE